MTAVHFSVVLLSILALQRAGPRASRDGSAAWEQPPLGARQLEPKEQSPMTVRWKPLLVLTGLFFVVAIVGLIAMTATLIPRSAQRVLKQARAAAGGGRYEDAEIYYKQALQFDAKSSALHEEMAQLYHDWSAAAPADRRELIRSQWYEHLVKAVKFDKTARTPRLQLLQAAIEDDSTSDAAFWAREVLNVEPGNADAHYILALEDLETRSPNVPEVKRHLKVLEEGKASPLRWRFSVSGWLKSPVTGRLVTRPAHWPGRPLCLPMPAPWIGWLRCASRRSRSRARTIRGRFRIR